MNAHLSIRRLARTAAALTLTLSTAAVTLAANASPAGAATFDPTLEAQVIELTNQHRARIGCPALQADARLATAARAHAANMADTNFFSHDDPQGRTAADRITASGFGWTGWAENISAVRTTAAEVVQGWLDSPGHRANIENCALTDIGVGYARGAGEFTHYWTQKFATIADPTTRIPVPADTVTAPPANPVTAPPANPVTAPPADTVTTPPAANVTPPPAGPVCDEIEVIDGFRICWVGNTGTFLD